MKTKPYALSLAVLAAVSLAMAPADDRTFEFVPSIYDFGSIREVDGNVSAIVKAVNVSPDTTFITSVRTSCGCTGATYTDRLLAPGDTAEITVSYNPDNRPGRFLKTIKIFSGLDRTSSSFKIKGNVIPGEKSLRKTYPHQIGGLRFSTTLLDLGEVSPGEVRPVFVGLYNVGDTPLVLTADSDSPAFESKVVPDTIPANDPGTLSVILKSRRLGEFEKSFNHYVYLIEKQSNDTIATIPIGGMLKKTE